MNVIVKSILLILIVILLFIPIFIRSKNCNKKIKKCNKKELFYRNVDTIQKKSDGIFIYRF